MKLFYRLIKPPSYIRKVRDILSKLTKARQSQNTSSTTNQNTPTVSATAELSEQQDLQSRHPPPVNDTTGRASSQTRSMDLRSWFGRYEWLPGMTKRAVINVANSSENLNSQIGMMLNASGHARQRSRQARQALRSNNSVLYYALAITTVLSVPLYAMMPMLALKTIADVGVIGSVLYYQARYIIQWYRTKRYNRRLSKGK